MDQNWRRDGVFRDLPYYHNISVGITFNSNAWGRRPPAGPKGPQPSAGARRGTLAPRTSSIGYCNTECELISMLLRKSPCILLYVSVFPHNKSVWRALKVSIPRKNLICDGTKQMDEWLILNWMLWYILINYYKCNYF